MSRVVGWPDAERNRRATGFAPSFWRIEVDLDANQSRVIEDAPVLDNYYTEVGRRDVVGPWGPLTETLRAEALRIASQRDRAAAAAHTVTTERAQARVAATVAIVCEEIRRTPAEFRWDNGQLILRADADSLLTRGYDAEQVAAAVLAGTETAWRRVALRFAMEER